MDAFLMSYGKDGNVSALLAKQRVRLVKKKIQQTIMRLEGESVS